MKKLYKSVIVFICTFVFLLASGCTFINYSGNKNGSTVGATDLPNSLVAAESVVVKESNSEERVKLDLADAYEKVERTAVAIEIKTTYQTTQGKTETATSYGSGVIVDITDEGRAEDEYYVLTCHHVISSGGTITVYLLDENLNDYMDSDYNEEYALTGKIGNEVYSGNSVTLVGSDKDSDVAVLKLDLSNTKINAENIEEAEVPPSDYKLRAGESVFAIGNPTGSLPSTVSSGYISHLNRETVVGDVGYMTLNQINVDIYHGNSGGGLYNYYGELVGLTNAGSDEDSGINYAICLSNSDEKTEDTGFKTIAEQLVATATGTNYGYITGRWQLGINVSADNYGNVQVSSIDESENAYKSGLRKSDYVVSIWAEEETKEEIGSVSEFSYAVYGLKKTHKLGDSFTIGIARYSNGNRFLTESTIVISLKEQYIFCNTGN